MANSRLLLLRLSCNNKPLMSFVGPNSSTIIRCNSTTPFKVLLGLNNGDNDQRQTYQINLNKDSTRVKASGAAAAAAATTQARDDEVRGGMFMLMDLVSSTSSANSHALLFSMLRNIADLINRRKYYFQKMQLQMFFERAIIDCRFFTLFAVAGSLLASVLCFVEGSLVVLKSYIHYFHALSHKADQGHVMQLLIEAIDTFLIGTAMLMFGIGLYTMFVGSKSVKEKGLAGSNLFGLFHAKRVPRWVEMKSVSDAKAKLGHAVMMILQVGVLEKFKSVPLVTGFDLACLAATLLISSASIFLLSRLSVTSRSRIHH